MSKKNEGKSEICKVVLLGESSVGKTCIISRFVDNEFDKEILSTTGASYANKTLKFKDTYIIT